MLKTSTGTWGSSTKHKKGVWRTLRERADVSDVVIDVASSAKWLARLLAVTLVPLVLTFCVAQVIQPTIVISSLWLQVGVFAVGFLVQALGALVGVGLLGLAVYNIGAWCYGFLKEANSEVD